MKVCMLNNVLGFFLMMSIVPGTWAMDCSNEETSSDNERSNNDRSMWAYNVEQKTIILNKDKSISIYKNFQKDAILRFVTVQCNKCVNRVEESPYWDKKGVKPLFFLPQWAETISELDKNNILDIWHEESSQKPIHYFVKLMCADCTNKK